jgi:hypothetical protein
MQLIVASRIMQIICNLLDKNKAKCSMAEATIMAISRLKLKMI